MTDKSPYADLAEQVIAIFPGAELRNVTATTQIPCTGVVLEMRGHHCLLQFTRRTVAGGDPVYFVVALGGQLATPMVSSDERPSVVAALENLIIRLLSYAKLKTEEAKALEDRALQMTNVSTVVTERLTHAENRGAPCGP